MAITNPIQELRAQPPQPTVGPQVALTGALAVVLAVATLVHRTLPGDALMPAVSLLFFVIAAVVALFAWRRPSPERQFCYSDVAGVLIFIGIFIAAQVEPEQMVRLVEGAHNQN